MLQNWRQRWNRPGGNGEVFRLALPFILSHGCWTLQLTIDRVMLSQWSSDAVAAATPAIMIFWTPLILLFSTSNYATTFVSQYIGSEQFNRVGAVVWQSLYFSIVGGLAFLVLVPLAPLIFYIVNHSPAMRPLETIYFQCLCFSALPTMVTAAVSSFFAGRGKSGTVLLINAVGLIFNAILDFVLITGRWGFPELGMAGAGWATVAGWTMSALFGFALFCWHRDQERYGIRQGRRWDAALFRRLFRFGFPSGVPAFLDGLAFSIFFIIVGQLGAAELAASSVAFTLNMVVFLPTLGFSQAVTVLVGQRLGENRPDLAERSTWSGFRWAWCYLAIAASTFVLFPQQLMGVFAPSNPDADWLRAAEQVPILLRFIAVYTLFDSVNLVFSFALRGAGDTRFVMWAALLLSWPIMVIPTIFARYYGWGLYWVWSFASAYIIILAFVFLIRFLGGKWKSMRVVEMPEEQGIDADDGAPDSVLEIEKV